MVPQHQGIGELTHRRPGRVRLAPDREQELMFGRSSQPGGLGLILAPTQKAPQAGAELEQMLEVGLVESHIV